MSNLTGNTQYRSNWLGQIILQVEVIVHRRIGAYSLRVEPYSEWKDATVADIQAIRDKEGFALVEDCIKMQKATLATLQEFVMKSDAVNNNALKILKKWDGDGLPENRDTLL